jgi:hypothetical protein
MTVGCTDTLPVRITSGRWRGMAVTTWKAVSGPLVTSAANSIHTQNGLKLRHHVG